MKKKPPIIEVIIPTGNSIGHIIILDMESQIINNNDPAKIEV